MLQLYFECNNLIFQFSQKTVFKIFFRYFYKCFAERKETNIDIKQWKDITPKVNNYITTNFLTLSAWNTEFCTIFLKSIVETQNKCNEIFDEK